MYENTNNQSGFSRIFGLSHTPVSAEDNVLAYKTRAGKYEEVSVETQNSIRLLELVDGLFYHPWAEKLAKEGARLGLDIGCGTGNRTDSLRKKMQSYDPQCEIFGCDAVYEMAEIARKSNRTTGKKPINAAVCDMRNLSYDSNVFDFATLMYYTFSILPKEEFQRSLKSIRRVLKNEGQILMDIPLFAKDNDFIKAFMLDKLIDDGHVEKKDRNYLLNGGKWPNGWENLIDSYRYLHYQMKGSEDRTNSTYLFQYPQNGKNEIRNIMLDSGFETNSEPIIFTDDMKMTSVKSLNHEPPQSIIFKPTKRPKSHTVLAICAKKI